MRLLLVLGVVSLSAAVTAHRLSAHGELDQYLEGYPNCAVNELPATFPADQHPRQEFVPSGTLVSSIQVCVASTIDTTLTVVIREGSAENPGSVLGEKTVPISIIDAWPSHADFDPLVRVERDETYVIEVRAPAGVAWRATETDRYCAGDSTAGAGDFAFISYDAVRASESQRTCDGSSSGSSWWVWVAGGAAVAAAAIIVGAGFWRRRTTAV